MFLKLLLWSGYFVPHTDPQVSVSVCCCTMYLYLAILRFVLTAKNINNNSFKCIFHVWVYFRNGKLRKGKCWETLDFVWIYIGVGETETVSINTNMFFFFFFFTASRCLSRLQVYQTCHIEYEGIGTDKTFKNQLNNRDCMKLILKYFSWKSDLPNDTHDKRGSTRDTQSHRKKSTRDTLNWLKSWHGDSHVILATHVDP